MKCINMASLSALIQMAEQATGQMPPPVLKYLRDALTRTNMAPSSYFKGIWIWIPPETAQAQAVFSTP